MEEIISPSQFEQDVLTILQLLPGMRAEPHVQIAGKDVDIVCTYYDAIGAVTKMAVECKHFARPLTREQVTAILADYAPVMTGGMDRFCLVTSAGIVATAKLSFNGRSTVHFTYAELLDQAFGPNRLVESMIQQFESDDLPLYYVNPRCFELDLKQVSQRFDLIYNRFTDFVIENIPDYSLSTGLDHARALLRKYEDAELAVLADSYTKKELAHAISTRTSTTHTCDLEQLVLSWIDEPGIGQELSLLGSYGMGKSTFAKRLAHTCARRYLEGKSPRIPLLIELRDFGSHQDIRGLITHELVNRYGVRNGSFDIFQILNRHGKFLLLLDGFDEMKQGMTRDTVLFNFNELNRLHGGKSKILLCGRPTAFSGEGEQTAILAGQSKAHFDNPTQYIQIRLAPFSLADSLMFLRKFMKVKAQQYAKAPDNLKLLEDQAEHSTELQELLARPVHLPMLAAYLPEWSGRTDELRRASLYKHFIDRIISREMYKQRSSSYSIDERHRFAADLAVEMFRNGESRSIRFSEIREEIIRPYHRLGQPLEAAKRDLIKACFLERKPPDVLYFPHKSFGEYLVAERLVEKINDPSPATDSILARSSAEILSFAVEMCSADRWRKVLLAPARNTRVVAAILKIAGSVDQTIAVAHNKSFRQLLLDEVVTDAWAGQLLSLPEILQFKWANYLDSVVEKGALPRRLSDQLLALLSDSRLPDITAVHLYRALNFSGAMNRDQLMGKIGSSRVGAWNAKGWFSQYTERDVSKPIIDPRIIDWERLPKPNLEPVSSATPANQTHMDSRSSFQSVEPVRTRRRRGIKRKRRT